jgi:hypothetical protein
MITIATLLAIKLNLAALLGHSAVQEPKTKCHIQTVSYKFVGEPGTAFLYAGERYSVPASGWIELLASGGPAVYTIANRELQLDVWPRDEFGTRTVPMPKPNQPVATIAAN